MGTWNWWQLLAVVARDCATPNPLLPAHTWLMQRCRPQNGRRLLVNVARLASSSFSLFFVIPLPCPLIFLLLFYIFFFFFTLLCGCFVFGPCPFLRLRHSRLFISNFISYEFVCFYRKTRRRVAAKHKQTTAHVRRCCSSSATLSAPPHLALKGCRLASRTELFVGCVWLFCSQMNVIYIFNNESDSHRTRFRLPPSASVFKTFKFKYIFYALIYCSLVFSRAHINVGCA